MSASPNYIQFKNKFQISPIILTRGIAASIGGGLPISSLTNGGVYLSSNGQQDGTGVDYVVAPGGTLIANQVAQYPFANQAVAANANIAQPLNVSMFMIVPAIQDFAYGTQLTMFTNLQSKLSQHSSLGGTYTVVTPKFIYVDALLLTLRDISGGETTQAQYRWQLDFYQPLVSLQSAQQAQNGLMQTFTNGTPVSGTPGWSTGLPVNNPAGVPGNVPSVVPSIASAPAIPPQIFAGNFGR